MPELPEVEITARLLDEALTGAEIESALAPGVNALKTFEPPLSALEGQKFTWVRRRGKLFVLELDGGMALVIHLMSAGRLQLFDTRASLRDRTSRLLVRLRDGRELRLREFGTKQRAWVKVIRMSEPEGSLEELGYDAWPDPPELLELLDEPRPLYALLRDQHVIAGIGRSWVDEILHTARLSPFKRGSDLEQDEANRLRTSIMRVLGGAIDTYTRELELPLPDKLPMPLTVHGRQGSPCPRCGTTLEAVFFEDYVVAYCPQCQTGGKLLKDRRLSRLLK